MGGHAISMTWGDLAFLHWPVPAASLRERIPKELELDTFDGDAWIGVVPFEMRRTRFRFAPPVPTATDFLELNLRTYVRHGDRAGVWFFSLDAESRLAVRGARASFALPYFNASMSSRPAAGGGFRYTSRRTHRGAPPADFAGSYGPTGPVFTAEPGTLEHFLTERYSLFSKVGYGVRYAMRRCLLRGDIQHVPWPLQGGEAELEVNDMFDLAGLELPRQVRLRPPVVHFASSIDVLAMAPKKSR